MIPRKLKKDKKKRELENRMNVINEKLEAFKKLDEYEDLRKNIDN